MQEILPMNNGGGRRAPAARPEGWAILRCSAVACLALLGLLAAMVRPAAAEEPAEKFLQRLRELQYFDTAIDYLNHLENSPLCTAEFRKRLLYEKAVTYIEASRQPSLRDIKRYEAYLDQAETWLDEFSDSEPAPEMYARAEKMRAQLFYTRGRNFLQQAESDRLTSGEIDEFRDQARGLLQKAATTLEENRNYVKDQYDNFVFDPENPEASNEGKTQLQREYVQVKVLAASVMESLADTYDSGSDEQKQQLAAAVEAHKFNWQEYRRFPEGLFSAVGAARCYQRMGNASEAIAYCVDLFELDNRTEFLPFKRQAAAISYEIWSRQDPLPTADIIGRYDPLVASLSPAEQRQGDWLKIQLLLARAFKLRADSYKGQAGADARRRQSSSESNAVKIARRVSRASGPTRDIAKQLLREWDLKVGESGEEAPNITTFEQARIRCRDLLSQVEDASAIYQASKQQAAAAGDAPPEAMLTELQQNLEILKEANAEVLEATRLALELSDDQTPTDDLAYIRYIQAYCYLSVDDFFDTIVIGEYLMDLYPSSPSSRDAAGLAVRAYLQLYLRYPEETPPEDQQFELQGLENLANQLIERWPGQRATESAAMIMTRLSLKQGKVEQAERYLVKISEESPLRAQEEIRLGQLYWFRYLKTADRQSDEAQGWLAKANQFLTSSVPRLTASDVSPETARGALSLVELYLEMNLPDKALHQLEMATVAPIDLLKQKHPAVDGDRYASDTYSAAVRVYLAALEQGGDATVLINKIKTLLGSLKQSLLAQHPTDGDARMLNIYLRLAEQSKAQLARIEDPLEKKGFADSLQGLLESIRADSTDSQTLLWVGSTLNQVGAAMTELKQDESARRIHGEAIEAFEKARGLMDQSGNESTAKVELEIDRQIALALRGSGRFKEAISKFADVLQQNPSLVNVQIDAAQTYQMWGEAETDATYFARAMAGGEKRERPNRAAANVIWGWRKLCKALINNERFAPMFAEALYNECRSRLRYGQIKNDSRSTRAWESAVKEINTYAARAPEMAGWRAKFDELVRELQKSLGRAETGIGGSQPEAP